MMNANSMLNGVGNGIYENTLNSLNMVNLKINNMVLIPTKRYNDVFRRSYELNATPSSMRGLEQIISNSLNRGTNIDPINIARNANDIFKMSDIPTEQIQIANGWSTIRMRFILEVESEMNNSLHISYIQGYTDYYDPSLSGRIDPNMPMHINTITNTIRTFDHASGLFHTRVNNSLNVIYDNSIKGYAIEDTTNSHKMIRPSDIVEGVRLNKMYESGVNVTNTKTQFGIMPQESKRDNNIASKHLTEVINSHLENVRGEYGSVGSSPADILNITVSSLAENNLYSIPFMDALSNLKGNIETVEFNLSLLEKLDPNIANVTTLVDNSTPTFNANPNMNILDTDMVEDNSIISPEATIANTVGENVTSLLVDDLLSVIDFNITNMSPNSEIVHSVSTVNSFIHDIDLRLYVERFINKFKTLVFPSISNNNMIGIDLFIHADIMAETTIAISINQAPMVVFRMPTFCNSLFSSMVTDNNKFDVMVDDFANILESVS